MTRRALSAVGGLGTSMVVVIVGGVLRELTKCLVRGDKCGLELRGGQKSGLSRGQETSLGKLLMLDEHLLLLGLEHFNLLLEGQLFN